MATIMAGTVLVEGTPLSKQQQHWSPVCIIYFRLSDCLSNPSLHAEELDVSTPIREPSLALQHRRPRSESVLTMQSCSGKGSARIPVV